MRFAYPPYTYNNTPLCGARGLGHKDDGDDDAKQIVDTRSRYTVPENKPWRGGDFVRTV